MLIRLWNHLSKRRQKQFIWMQIFIVVASFFEMASLGAVVPFLGVLSEPEPVFQNEYLQPFIKFFDITEANQLALPMTGFVRMPRTSLSYYSSNFVMDSY